MFLLQVVGYLNLLANSIDNFTHGLAVAGSFIVSTKVSLGFQPFLSCDMYLCLHLFFNLILKLLLTTSPKWISGSMETK